MEYDYSDIPVTAEAIKDAEGWWTFNTRKALAKLERDNTQLRSWVDEIFKKMNIPPGDMGALENYILSKRE